MRMIDTVRLTGFGSVLGPLALFLVSLALRKRKSLFRAVSIGCLCGYVLLILYATLFRKPEAGARQINLTPFWSYTRWHKLDIRWQVYMNMFLFIPFGFMLPWGFNRNFVQTVLIGCLLSMFIEAVQYFFGLGLCEFDDLFHNTLGAAVGYGYWKALRWLGKAAAKARRRDS